MKKPKKKKKTSVSISHTVVFTLQRGYISFLSFRFLHHTKGIFMCRFPQRFGVLLDIGRVRASVSLLLSE